MWTQQGSKLVGTGAVGAAQQGYSVALSGDDNTAIVGGDGDNGFAGAAWVYGRPGLTGISPSAGTVDGGTGVTIMGANLFNVTGVTFAGVAATNVIPVDAETVQATTPSHAAGAVNVTVSTKTGLGTAKRAYTYQRNPTVTSITSSVNPSSFGQRVTFTATVSAGGITAHGTVTFTCAAAWPDSRPASLPWAGTRSGRSSTVTAGSPARPPGCARRSFQTTWPESGASSCGALRPGAPEGEAFADATASEVSRLAQSVGLWMTAFLSQRGGKRTRYAQSEFC